jgi:hypothetical protein
MLCTLGATVANLTGFYYGHRFLHPTLQVFLIAPPASGKGVMGWAKQLAAPLHESLLRTYEQGMARYKREHLAWVNMGKDRAQTEEPEPPVRRLFFISGDNTGSGILENLVEQQGLGMISEPEASVLSAAIHSDYGNWSSTLRKAFDHDGVSYNRKSDHEHRECPHTLLSVLISGTPGQLQPLIPSAENGLYSRVLFYHLPPIQEWQSQFGQGGIDYPALFEQWGRRWMRLLQALRGQVSRLTFRLTPEQEAQFDTHFAQLFRHAGEAHNHEGRSAVARIAINVMRLLNIVALLRVLDDVLTQPDDAVYADLLPDLTRHLLAHPQVEPGTEVKPENAQDGVVSALQFGITQEDYDAVMCLSDGLYRHSAYTLRLFPDQKPQERPATRKEALLAALPMEFKCEDAQRLAQERGISERTIRRYLRSLLENGTLEQPSHGQYRFSTKYK